MLKSLTISKAFVNALESSLVGPNWRRADYHGGMLKKLFSGYLERSAIFIIQFKNGLTLLRACDKLPHQLNFAHQERQRDRPCEASATAKKVPIPAGLMA